MYLFYCIFLRVFDWLLCFPFYFFFLFTFVAVNVVAAACGRCYFFFAGSGVVYDL